MKVGKIMLFSGAVVAAIGFLLALGLAGDSDVFGAPMSYLSIRVALAVVLMAGGYVVARIGQDKMERMCYNHSKGKTAKTPDID